MELIFPRWMMMMMIRWCAWWWWWISNPISRWYWIDEIIIMMDAKKNNTIIRRMMKNKLWMVKPLSLSRGRTISIYAALNPIHNLQKKNFVFLVFLAIIISAIFFCGRFYIFCSFVHSLLIWSYTYIFFFCLILFKTKKKTCTA